MYSVDGGDQGTVSSWSHGDSVSIADSGDAITNPSTGENIAVTQIGDSNDAKLYANTGDHSLQTNSSDGSIVVLEDGSVWIVTPAQRSLTSVWIDPNAITVNESSGPTYELANTDSQDLADASYIGQE